MDYKEPTIFGFQDLYFGGGDNQIFLNLLYVTNRLSFGRYKLRRNDNMW